MRDECDGERELVGAILNQALTDATHPQHGAEAIAFLTDAKRIGWFCHLVGSDAAKVHLALKRALADRLTGLERDGRYKRWRP